MNFRRVVITGLGLRSPLGTAAETWTRLIAGESGISRIDELSGQDIQIGGFADFDWKQEVSSVKVPIQASKRTALMLSAARQALQANHSFKPYDFGLALGFSGTDMPCLLSEIDKAAADGSFDPFFAYVIAPNSISTAICNEFSCFGHFTVSQENSASGLFALGNAYHAVARGDAEVSLVLSGEHSVHPRVLELYNRIGFLNFRDNGDPLTASRPFDKNRRGAVLADCGAAILVEELSHALNRGATPIAEIKSFTSMVDSRLITKLPEDGYGLNITIDRCLGETDRLDAIFASACGSLEGDYIEANVIRELLGPKTPVCALKGSLGHSLGCSGLASAVVAAQSLENQVIPPTLNSPQPEANVKSEAEKASLRSVLVEEAGWGGYNAAVLLSKVE
mmetsp:Transcript_1930/g.4275  ORF Transcript_1930/g.4275 Transcript_1930/m.4275 type:complete len:394 (-) Transcript_1930:25-1206(-)